VVRNPLLNDHKTSAAGKKNNKIMVANLLLRMVDRESCVPRQRLIVASKFITLATYLAGLFLFMALLSCSPASGRGPKRIMENGMEVVVNGADPYALKGEPRALLLREEFRIDTEDEQILTAGLADVATIDVDSEGRIYAFRRGGNSGHLIFRFDDRGRFQKSFVPIGQGPGEVLYPKFMRITAEGEIPVVNRSARRVDFFDLDGRFLRKLALPEDTYLLPIRGIERLANGNYLVLHFSVGPNLEVLGIVLTMTDSAFHTVKDLYEAPFPGEQIETPFIDYPLFAASNRAVFVSSYKPGSDIAIYDLDGVPVRGIRLDYPTPKITPGFREAFLSQFHPPKSPQLKSLKFPEYFPHVQAMFTDDAGRLIISSFGKDSGSGANICDVFTPGGVRILRTSLGFQDVTRWADSEMFDVVIKNGRAYSIGEKGEGFKEIIVYALTWSGPGA
jgi:hypothetical protein